MKKVTTIAQVLKNPELILNDDNSYGFYDWFCKDTSLKNKATKLFNQFKRISSSNKIKQDSMYIWFKNHCPMVGSLYEDDFRISDVVTNDMIYAVVPESGFKEDNGIEAEVWGKENNFKEPIIRGSFKEIVDWFNS